MTRMCVRGRSLRRIGRGAPNISHVNELDGFANAPSGSVYLQRGVAVSNRSGTAVFTANTRGALHALLRTHSFRTLSSAYVWAPRCFARAHARQISVRLASDSATPWRANCVTPGPPGATRSLVAAYHGVVDAFRPTRAQHRSTAAAPREAGFCQWPACYGSRASVQRHCSISACTKECRPSACYATVTPPCVYHVWHFRVRRRWHRQLAQRCGRAPTNAASDSSHHVGEADDAEHGARC